MNKKLILLLITVISVIVIILVGFYGIDAYNDGTVLASGLSWQSSELRIDEEEKVYYYLPSLQEQETKRIYLDDFVVLEGSPTNGKETLSYSISYSDDLNGPSLLELVTEGTLKGWLTIKGQTSATVIVSTTDGSELSASLLIRPSKNKPGEIIEGDL